MRPVVENIHRDCTPTMTMTEQRIYSMSTDTKYPECLFNKGTVYVNVCVRELVRCVPQYKSTGPSIAFLKLERYLGAQIIEFSEYIERYSIKEEDVKIRFSEILKVNIYSRHLNEMACTVPFR